jgi:hypothetical protein
MSFGSRFQRCDFTPAGIYKKYVDATVFLFHDCIEPVQILQARYVARDRRDVSTDKGCGLFQLFLASTADYNVRAFFNENAWLWLTQSRCFRL